MYPLKKRARTLLPPPPETSIFYGLALFVIAFLRVEEKKGEAVMSMIAPRILHKTPSNSLHTGF